MLSEAEVQKQRIEALANASLSRILKEGLLECQDARGAAYARLNDALRSTMSGNDANYAAVCANCTEDLKLASEGVMTLREVCHRRLKAGDKSFKSALTLIDNLQTFEEQKMVAMVSVHAIKRSRKLGGDEAVTSALKAVEGTSSTDTNGDRESVEQKVVRFSKRLMTLDEQIAELVDEAREIIVDADSQDSQDAGD